MLARAAMVWRGQKDSKKETRGKPKNAEDGCAGTACQHPSASVAKEMDTQGRIGGDHVGTFCGSFLFGSEPADHALHRFRISSARWG